MPFNSRLSIENGPEANSCASMAGSTVLTRLLGVWLQVALIAKSPSRASGLPQPARNADLAEDSNDTEFRPNSMGISKVIDLNTGTIAYKDHILKSCFIEKITSSYPWEKDRMLIIYPRLLTNEQVVIIGGKIVSNFCFGWPSRILRSPNNLEVRSKRSNNQYYFVGRKARGQTQSQYLQFGNGESPGRAEAEASRVGSKATVFGSRGMGQAQSQSDPFSCADCYGFGGTGGSGTQQIDTFGPGSITAGRQLDASGRPLVSRTGSTDDGRQGHISVAQQPGIYLPGQIVQKPDGRVIYPGATGQTGGELPGPSSTQPAAGQTGRIQERPGTGTYLSPGQAGGVGDGTDLLYPGGQAPGQNGRHGQVAGSLQTYPGQNGIGSSAFVTPGHKPGLSQIHPGPLSSIEGPTTGTTFISGQGPGLQQTYPGQIGGIQTTTRGQSPGAIQQHPDQQEGTFLPGLKPSSQEQYPGHAGLYGGVQSPSGSIFIPGQRPDLQQQGAKDTFTPGQKPGSLQIRPDQTSGTQQLYPGQIENIQTAGGQTIIPDHGPGSIITSPTGPQHTRPAVQIYDHDGLQRPSGRPVHPEDIRTVPVGQETHGSISTKPGETTYFIPGGIRPRPGDGTFAYYPSTSPPNGRLPSGVSTQDGSFQGQVAGQYRPASGLGGDFSGTFEGTYHRHGDTTQQTYPGASGAQIDLSGSPIGQSPQGPPAAGSQTGQGTYLHGQAQSPSGSQLWTEQSGQEIRPGTQISDHIIYQPGTGAISDTSQTGYQHGSGQTTIEQFPGQLSQQPGHGQISTSGQYPDSVSRQPQRVGGGGAVPGQKITTSHYPEQPGYQPGKYPIGSVGQTGYEQTEGLSPGSSTLDQFSGQPGTGFIPTQQPSGGRYPSQPGYQQEISSRPQYPGTSAVLLPGQQQGGAGGPQPGYQQETSIGPQYTRTGTGFLPGHQPSQPGYQHGISTGPQYSGTSQQQSGTIGQYPGQPGYQQASTGPQYSGSGLTPGQYPGGAAPGQIQYPGAQQVGYQQHLGQPIETPGEIGQYGQSGQTFTGGQVGAGSPGTSQIGQYVIPGSGQIGQAQFGQGGAGDDSDTQAQSSIQRADNETQASASSSGRYQGGTAQSQVSGSYAGTGSFSASAGTNDGVRGAQTQVSGNSEGTLSSSQGTGGRAKSQAQVQLSADTGDTQSSAQTGGLNHGTNTQVESGIKGGMADAQANGPGSTSSQAQIGFVPYDAANNDDDPENPHNGGGTASASSGTHAGKSQVQINGKYAFGIRYTGQAQASSANAGYTAENINLPTMKPIDFSQAPQVKPGKQEKINVRQIDDPDNPSLIKIITSSTTPNPDEEEDDYEYDDPDPPSSQQNLLQQARTRSLMRDALDPLEDIEEHEVPVRGQLKHGDIIQTGQFIPGSPGYKIPEGFRGRVTEGSDHLSVDKRIIYAAGANANRRGYHEGYGSGYFYQPRYSPLQYGFKSSAQPKNFVSMTKSETGSRNIATGKKTPSSTYYTQSSTCGYFTNTCVYSNGRKICLPKPKANPDGTPIICRN